MALIGRHINNLQCRCSVTWGRIINTRKMNVNMY